MMRPATRLAAASLYALTLAGCAAPMTVSSYMERGIDFTQYQTYDWGPEPELETGDPRLDANPFFHEQVQANVEKQLAARGFQKATSGTPELLIHYHASVNQEVDVNGADQDFGYCEREDCTPFVYEAGTLLFDFVDTRTNRVVWRGWAEGSVDGVVDDQKWMEERIADAVTRIMEKLPPRL